MRQLQITMNFTNAFYTKFESSKKVIKPNTYIHLFRSINKYPTYLIDDSLSRELYYNVRFKLSPRVVRHDDIAIGQQNKGPLRDGFYIFQMAVLKNDQGRLDGHENMVKTQFSQDQDVTKKPGTTSIYSCSNDKPFCGLTEEDVIIPVTNTPIVIRDGMMKADIRIHIRREHLAFANSKNILIFRILPADPGSIVCKDGITECTMETPEYEDSYEANIDWKETIKSIKPASTDDYDMFFYTYKTPFIPSLWANWNITHELDIPFDDLTNYYKNLTDKEIIGEEVGYLEKNKKHLEKLEQHAATVIPEGELYGSDLLARMTDQLQAINPAINETGAADKEQKVKSALLEQLKKTKDELDEKMNYSRHNMTEEEIKEAIQERDRISDEIDTIRNNGLQTIVEPKLEKLETSEESGTGDAVTDSIFSNNNAVKQTDTPDNGYFPSACTDKYTVEGDTDEQTESSDNTSCLQRATNQKQEEDWSQRHIVRFASTNALCTININSDLQLSQKNCGNFNSTGQSQQFFLDDLNKNIQDINRIKEEINSSGTQKKSTMEKSFQRNHSNSVVFRNKLQYMPALPTLNEDDLEEIILSDIKANINDNKTGAFLHALCGFWFSDFLSDKYTTADLLLDGFRQTVKKTFYYKIRGIALPEDDQNETMQSLSHGVTELEKQYAEYLKKQKIKGHIDNLHKWADNPSEYDLVFPSYEGLYKKFDLLSKKSPFTNEKPSWERQHSVVTMIKNILNMSGDTENEEKVDNNFDLTGWLKEAVEANNLIKGRTNQLRRIRKHTDYHPVRKCINNPSHFFGIEKKIIVGKVHEKSKYTKNGTGGEQTTLNVSEDFFMNTQRDQGGNQQFETSLNSNLTLFALPLLALAASTGAGIVGLLPTLLSSTVPAVTFLSLTALIGGVNYSYRGYEGTGKRRLLSIRVSEGVTLIAERTPITISLEKYHECLAIRPRFSAFEPYNKKYEHIWSEQNKAIKSLYTKIGILLCTQGKKKGRFIQEDYYYIYPNYTINGITIDPSSHRNKPFMISLRGQKEYKKFLHNLSCYVTENREQLIANRDCRDTRANYEYLLSKNIEFAENLRQGFYIPKMFHLTGDLPGVHSPYIEEADRDINANSTWTSTVMRRLMNWSVMDKDVETIVRSQPGFAQQ